MRVGLRGGYQAANSIAEARVLELCLRTNFDPKSQVDLFVFFRHVGSRGVLAPTCGFASGWLEWRGQVVSAAPVGLARAAGSGRTAPAASELFFSHGGGPNESPRTGMGPHRFQFQAAPDTKMPLDALSF